MSTGVAILLIACVYVIMLGIMSGLKNDSKAHMRFNQQKGYKDKYFIAFAFGAVLFIVAYMIIIPVPEPGTDRWFNSVLILRLFWKVFGSLFAASGSFMIAMFIGGGIGTLFNKKETADKKKRKLGWKSLDKDEALAAFNELYIFEKNKVEITLTAQNVTNAHEGYYGRYNSKIEQVVREAPLADVRIAAVQKLRGKNQLESVLSIEKDESVRKAIKMEITKREALRY